MWLTNENNFSHTLNLRWTIQEFAFFSFSLIKNDNYPANLTASLIFRELEEENNALQAEYERLRGSKSNSCATLPAKTGDVDMATEAKMLRQHKGRLEARMQILEEHNRQLEAQLQRLRQLLDEVISYSEIVVRSSDDDSQNSPETIEETGCS